MDFSIPAAYRDKLTPVEVTDERTDGEILATFQEYQPVTSEKNVWAYWHAGVENMPKWCQKNVIDWVRILGPGWTVRVLDNVPGSPNNTLCYVPDSLLPPAFVDRTMDGPFLGQHGADLTRSACLYEHGGAWMDVGNILIRHLDRVCWDELEDPDSPYRVAIPIIYGLVGGNHFVAARKNDPFIYQWHRLFTHVWGNKKNIKGCSEDPLIAPILPMMFEGETAEFDPDWIDPAQVLEYITQIVCWTRLFCLEEAGEGFSGVDYWQNHIFAFSCLEEDWRGEYVTSFVGFGERAFDALQLPHSGPTVDQSSEKYKEAEKLIWELLASASMWKVAHAPGLARSVYLGGLLDQPEHEGKEAQPGTFGELLRQGTVRLRQTRTDVVRMPTLRPSTTLKKGVLEP
ncbi:hypothetical protein ABOM_009019 [Aspergillus bombycis]|uniref:Capsule polysaccharide biosynthesis protein n=1 Tax=Aspergillus bombycis TaxID=109264 RepID=A0A1F7ZTK3_9EURO|nr:hypothetical protein ABOM_009019 [Aspergillus bombycis]OGM42780.1 hypothetical protein ABOM_009019 [Aspergillus bombycis]